MRRSRQFLIFPCLLLVVAAAQAHDPQERDVIKKEYDVRPGGTLHLDLDYGQVEIESSASNKVMIELVRTAQAEDRDIAKGILAQHEYAFDKKNDDVHIRSRFNKERGMIKLRKRRKLRIKVTVRVPEHYNVEFSSGAGNIEIGEIEGHIKGSTGAGNIVINDVRGVVDISAGAGNIEIAGDIKRANVKSGAGNISLYGLQGYVDAGTGAGNILAVITQQPEHDSKLHSGAGNVIVELSDDVNVYVHATAALGSAQCDFPLVISKKGLSKSFAGEINGKGPEIRMRTSVGNVTLRRN